MSTFSKVCGNPFTFDGLADDWVELSVGFRTDFEDSFDDCAEIGFEVDDGNCRLLTWEGIRKDDSITILGLTMIVRVHTLVVAGPMKFCI